VAEHVLQDGRQEDSIWNLEDTFWFGKVRADKRGVNGLNTPIERLSDRQVAQGEDKDE
jgi:hypothetical protein